MSPSASDVSVITVNWNGRHHLEHLLPSLELANPGEILVVDNGSRDDSVAWIGTNYPRVRVLQNDSNRGFAEPNNVAAAEAKGSVLAFVNNDMRCHRDWLANGLQGLQQSECVASRILDWEGRRIDFNGSSLQYLGYAAQKDIGATLETVRSEDWLLFPCGGAMLVRKEVFLELGGFDPAYFAIFEDVDFGWRLWLTGGRVRFCRDSVCYHRGHGTFSAHDTSKMRYLMHRNALMTIVKNYSDENLKSILPLAIVTSIKRAVRLTGVRRESFYLWADTRQRYSQGDPFVGDDLEDAFNHLIAVEDVLDQLPHLMEQRKRIQARRTRSDGEIIQLFGDPLRPIVEDPAYIESEAALLEGLGLDKLFDVSSYRDLGRTFSDNLPERLRRAREELKHLQWSGIYALRHPPRTPAAGRLRRLWDLWRTEGLRKTARQVIKAVRRAP